VDTHETTSAQILRKTGQKVLQERIICRIYPKVFYVTAQAGVFRI
jgi:hypothetical protein